MDNKWGKRRRGKKRGEKVISDRYRSCQTTQCNGDFDENKCGKQIKVKLSTAGQKQRSECEQVQQNS